MSNPKGMVSRVLLALWVLGVLTVFPTSCSKQSPTKKEISLAEFESLAAKVGALYENEKRPVREQFADVAQFAAAVKRFNEAIRDKVVADPDLKDYFSEIIIPKLREKEKSKNVDFDSINYYSQDVQLLIIALVPPPS